MLAHLTTVSISLMYAFWVATRHAAPRSHTGSTSRRPSRALTSRSLHFHRDRDAAHSSSCHRAKLQTCHRNHSRCPRHRHSQTASGAHQCPHLTSLACGLAASRRLCRQLRLLPTLPALPLPALPAPAPVLPGNPEFFKILMRTAAARLDARRIEQCWLPTVTSVLTERRTIHSVMADDNDAARDQVRGKPLKPGPSSRVQTCLRLALPTTTHPHVGAVTLASPARHRSEDGGDGHSASDEVRGGTRTAVIIGRGRRGGSDTGSRRRPSGAAAQAAAT
jgi:hypothetical protein